MVKASNYRSRILGLEDSAAHAPGSLGCGGLWNDRLGLPGGVCQIQSLPAKAAWQCHMRSSCYISIDTHKEQRLFCPEGAAAAAAAASAAA